MFGVQTKSVTYIMFHVCMSLVFISLVRYFSLETSKNKNKKTTLQPRVVCVSLQSQNTSFYFRAQGVRGTCPKMAVFPLPINCVLRKHHKKHSSTRTARATGGMILYRHLQAWQYHPTSLANVYRKIMSGRRLHPMTPA